jgi:hypothetical protein
MKSEEDERKNYQAIEQKENIIEGYGMEKIKHVNS